MADRILTTHAGSLPRPDDLADMIWAQQDGQDVDEAALEERIESAVKEIVEKQRDAGIDIVSDGEMSKTGFSTYVNQRFSGFEGTLGVPGRRRRPVPQPGDATVQHPGDGAPRVRQLRGTGEAEGQGCGSRGRRAAEERDRRRRSVERFHRRDQPGTDRLQLPRPALRLARDLPRGAGRRAVLRVQGDHRRGVQSPDRLARHGDGGALPLGRLERGRLAHASAARGRRAQRRARPAFRRSRCGCTSAGATTAAHITRTSRWRTSSTRCSESTRARSTSRAPTPATRTSGACSRRRGCRRIAR